MSNLKSKWWPSYGFEKNMDCFPEISISYLSFSLNTFPLFSDGWDYQRDLFLYSYCWLTNKSPHCTKYGQNIKAWECVENFSSWISDIPSPGDSVEMLCCVMLHYSDIILWSCRPVILLRDTGKIWYEDQILPMPLIMMVICWSWALQNRCSLSAWPCSSDHNYPKMMFFTIRSEVKGQHFSRLGTPELLSFTSVGKQKKVSP